jgi:hypothetical protein
MTLDDARALWREWTASPYPNEQYPPGGKAGTVNGVDLALTSGDVAFVLGDFFDEGQLRPDARQMLPAVLSSLELAVPSIAEPGQRYFADALTLVRYVDSSGTH